MRTGVMVGVTLVDGLTKTGVPAWSGAVAERPVAADWIPCFLSS